MISKDCYVVLGVPRTESHHGIRSAFRDLIREHHPDRAGPEGTATFREIVEAYRVLSDPVRRRAHDAWLSRRDSTRPGTRVRSRSSPDLSRFDALRLFREPAAIHPSADALFDRIRRNFTPAGLTKSEHHEPLLCDVTLTHSEASRGGILPIELPILSPCPRCHGAGHFAGFRCGACNTAGRVRSDLPVPLRVPPGIPSGAILELPLDDWGIHNLWLRARIRVAG